MNHKHVNAICRATRGILTNHFGVEATSKNPSAGSGNIPSNDVAVILGVKGELRGQIICSFSDRTAKKLVSIMMGGMEIHQLDQIGWSAVQEFGNWVAGNTATELSKEACIIDVTPPVVNEGNSTFRSAAPFITVPLTSQIGDIQVHISVKND